MHILFVVQHYYPETVGGAGQSVQTLAEGLVGRGHTVTVVRSHKEKYTDISNHNGVKIYAIPVRNIYHYDPTLKTDKKPAWMRIIWHAIDLFNPWAMWDFKKILDEVKPDVVNTNTLSGFSTSLFYIVKWKGIRLVHTMRDYYLMCPQSSMYKNNQSCDEICASCKPFAAVRKQAAKRVDVFLSNSKFVQDRHDQHNMFPENVIKFPQYNMNAAGKMGNARVRDISKPLRFGFIGNIIPTKGVNILLQACNQLHTDNWTLKIAGKGTDNYVTELKKIANDDRVEFIGWVNSNEFYNDIDVLICPSTYHDPLPRVIYEAYKSGLPVIASNTGGNPEIVDHEKTGYIYAASDTKILAKYMQQFLDMPVDDYNKMSRFALEKAEMFEPETILKDYEEKITCKI